MPTDRKYGWRPDVPDFRDKVCKITISTEQLPSRVDLREGCPYVYNQGQLGSCTGQAIAGAHQFEQIKQKLAHIFDPSRLFIYYNERDMEGTIDEDAGAMIRDGIKSVVKIGVCPESMWPYSDDSNAFKKRPTQECFDNAVNHQVTSYERVVPTENGIKSVLASGNPIVCGISIYESFESQVATRTGIIPMPSQRERLLGGHAVVIVGYDDAIQKFIMRNSWGPAWGDKGYFYLDYAYLTNSNLSDDFWTIKMVEDEDVCNTTTTTVTIQQKKSWFDWFRRIFG